VAAAERDRAERELAKSEEALGFLEDLFRGATPNETKGEEVTARQLLDRGARDLDRLDEDDIKGRMMTTIGRAYGELGDLPRSDSLTVQAVALLRDHAAEDTSRRAQLELAQALGDLGVLRIDQTRFADAERAFREELRLRERHAAENADLRQSMIQLRRAVSKQGRLREAARLQREELRLLRAAYEAGEEEPLYVAAAANNLSTTLQRLGLYERSLPPAREAVRLLDAENAAADVGRSFVLTNLGLAYANLARPLEGLPHVRRALAMRDTLLDAPHPLLAIAHHNVAEVLYYAGRFDEARRWSEEAQRRVIGLHGEEHADVADALHTYGQLLHRQGDLAGAERVHRRVERIRRAVLGDEHVRVAKTLAARALVHLDAGQPADAEAALRAARAVVDSASAVPHPFGHAVDGYLGMALAAQGRTGEAEPILRAAYDSLLTATEGQERIKAPRVAGALADLLAARDAPDAAAWRTRSARPDSLAPGMPLDVID
jgi:serine/threonine-protein kinase